MPWGTFSPPPPAPAFTGDYRASIPKSSPLLKAFRLPGLRYAQRQLQERIFSLCKQMQ